MPRYLLDTNIFIQAEQDYGLDVFPGFWEWLIIQHSAGKLASIEKVYDEIQVPKDDDETQEAKGDNKIQGARDDLAKWAKECGRKLFIPLDEDVVKARMEQVGYWARTGNHAPRAVREFLDGADSYLVAHALVHQDIVVTYESREVYKPKQNIKRIKIPNACDHFNIECIRPDEMLRREGARFVLGDAGRGPPA